jgi:hypoxanthine phosphoribosyltransferase
MLKDVERILITSEEIGARVRELGQQITNDYAGQEILMIGVLRGAVIFMADLARSIKRPMDIDFMAITSYGLSTNSSGVVRIIKDLDEVVEGRHILIIEDIIDSGLTLNYLVDNIKSRKPASVRICTLLSKPDRRKVNVTVDYNGFIIPDHFVVGYGLDYAGKYRNLPFIGVLKPEIYQKG